jgi:hypothetical protein
MFANPYGGFDDDDDGDIFSMAKKAPKKEEVKTSVAALNNKCKTD